MSHTMIGILFKGFLETLTMSVVSCFFAVLFGLPLGIILYWTKNRTSWLHHSIGLCMDIIRSVPFIILMVAIIPFTRFLVGTSIGTSATIVPLSLASIPFFARLTESAFYHLPSGLTEAGMAMGASSRQIIFSILLPESTPALIHSATLTLITLIGYSAMAGVIGGGGLGDIAIQYGYERFQMDTMLSTVLLLIVMVCGFQWLGQRFMCCKKK